MQVRLELGGRILVLRERLWVAQDFLRHLLRCQALRRPSSFLLLSEQLVLSVLRVRASAQFGVTRRLYQRSGTLLIGQDRAADVVCLQILLLLERDACLGNTFASIRGCVRLTLL